MRVEVTKDTISVTLGLGVGSEGALSATERARDCILGVRVTAAVLHSYPHLMKTSLRPPGPTGFNGLSRSQCPNPEDEGL